MEGGSGCVQGNQNSLKLSSRRDEMNRTISSAPFRHSVWKYRRASGSSDSELLASWSISWLGQYIDYHLRV